VTYCSGTTDGVFEAGSSDFDNKNCSTEGRSGGEENTTFCLDSGDTKTQGFLIKGKIVHTCTLGVNLYCSIHLF